MRMRPQDQRVRLASNESQATSVKPESFAFRLTLPAIATVVWARVWDYLGQVTAASYALRYYHILPSR